MSPSANDNASAFHDFMTGYWHQMSPELYSGLEEALADYKAMEGERRYEALLAALRQLAADNQLPALDEIQTAYDDPFWLAFDRILTVDEFNTCGASTAKS